MTTEWNQKQQHVFFQHASTLLLWIWVVAVAFRSEAEVCWRRGPLITYLFCHALDPPLGRCSQNILRFCKTAIMWLWSLTAILPLFWRHGIANLPAFAAKTWEMLLWRHEIYDVSRGIGLMLYRTCSFSTILQWNLIFSLLTRLGTPIFQFFS